MDRRVAPTILLLLLSTPLFAKAPHTLPEIEMVSIPGGTFVMGTANGEYDEKPEHPVTLSGFEISKYEITVAQYRAFARATSREMPPAPSFELADDHPVVNVSWDDASAFAEWLSRASGRTYRLPTEAEWAYAARAGQDGPYASGTDAPSGNVADDAGKTKFGERRFKGYRDGFVNTAPVGSFGPNAFGVFDLDGNAAEWCQNWHYTYSAEPQRDPRGPDAGKNKVFRGAAFISDPWYSRIAQRGFMPTDFRADYLGIRLVRIPAPAPTR